MTRSSNTLTAEFAYAHTAATPAARNAISATGASAKMKVALWTAQAALAALFVFAGVMKFVMSAQEMQNGGVDLPLAFLRFIGVCEMLGGAGVLGAALVGRTRALAPLAAAGLTIIMAGAVVITVIGDGVALAAMPLVIGVVAAFVAWNRRSWLVGA